MKKFIISALIVVVLSISSLTLAFANSYNYVVSGFNFDGTHRVSFETLSQMCADINAGLYDHEFQSGSSFYYGLYWFNSGSDSTYRLNNYHAYLVQYSYQGSVYWVIKVLGTRWAAYGTTYYGVTEGYFGDTGGTFRAQYNPEEISNNILNDLERYFGPVTVNGNTYDMRNMFYIMMFNLQSIDSRLATLVNSLSDIYVDGTVYRICDNLAITKINMQEVSSSLNRISSQLTSLLSKLDNTTSSGVSSSSASGIPSEYLSLEYIESTGTQYINSGLFYDGSPIQVDARFSYTSALTGQYLFGYWVDFYDAYYAQVNSISSLPWNTFCNGQWLRASDSSLTTNTIYDYSSYCGNGRQYISVNGVNVASGTASLSPSFGSIPMYVLAANDIGYTNACGCMSCRLYSMKIYMDGVLVRDYHPVMRYSDGSIGLYDSITQTFYMNAGSGTFIAGTVLLNWQYDLLSQIQSVNASMLDRLDTIIANLRNETGLPNCDHHYVAEESQTPTCVLPGLMVYTCDLCGASYSEIMESLGHDWLCMDHVEPVTDADGEVVQSGYDVYTCRLCERTYYDYDGVGAPENESGHTITDLISQLFGKIGSFFGGLLSTVINMLDKLLTGFDNIISSFNEKTQQIVNFGGDYPAWLGGVWSIMPADLQLALGFCVLCLALGIIGKKTVFA